MYIHLDILWCMYGCRTYYILPTYLYYLPVYLLPALELCSNYHAFILLKIAGIFKG